jgi:opacity protein-like surface antigen
MKRAVRYLLPFTFLPFTFFLASVLLLPAKASADVTGFIGASSTPSTRMVKGLAVGTGLLIVGFEFEYAHTNEDLHEDLQKAAPGLRTFMFNGLVQTPIPIAGMQFYGTAGGGVFRETLDQTSKTNVGINVGGGVKISLIGPLRLRLDYRVFTLRGTPLYDKPQRFYAGINLKF